MVDVNKKKPDEQPARKRSFARRLGSFVKWMVVLGFMGVLFVGGALMGYVSSIVKDEPVRSRALIEQKSAKTPSQALLTLPTAARSVNYEQKKTGVRSPLTRSRRKLLMQSFRLKTIIFTNIKV